MGQLIPNLKDLTRLPRVEDSISYLYLEHCVVEKDAFSIVAFDDDGATFIPVANITCLILGPGTKITHAAIRCIAENGCFVVWSGEQLRKFYAYGAGETRSSKNIQRQIILWYEHHLDVVKRMYQIRFPDMKTDGMSLEQLRGLEGVRVKTAYKTASKMYNIPWHGRKCEVDKMDPSDDLNRALTLANDLLYAICEAVIVSLGYSPAIGFIHTGHMRSFVYDVADFYKTQITIPAAFDATKNNVGDIDKAIRVACRKRFASYNLLKAVTKDIETVFNIDTEIDTTIGIWTGQEVVEQSKNYGSDIRTYLAELDRNDSDLFGNSG